MAGVLGAALGRVAGAGALARGLLPAAEGARGCLLMLHRVARPEQWPGLPNQGFHLDAEALGALLDYLGRTGWAVVTMDEALRRLRDGQDGGRFVNVSIDDIYRDTWALAAPLFRRRNLPVTLFVTTGIPDRTVPLWTAGLETILLERDRVVLPDGASVRADTPARKRALFARLAAAWEAAGPAAPYERLCALNGYAAEDLHDRHAITWAMLEELGRDPLVEIGGHTVSHARLTALSDADARMEITGCRRRLQDRLGLPVRHFAFPYGRRGDCGAREAALAREAGFASAATTRKGLVGAADLGRPHALPRNTLNGTHRRAAHVELHLTGLGGLAARVLRAT
jgi:peptidoglycan/xylan/chitin deacetylase (PgdA/CDA1 family)